MILPHHMQCIDPCNQYQARVEPSGVERELVVLLTPVTVWQRACGCLEP